MGEKFDSVVTRQDRVSNFSNYLFCPKNCGRKFKQKLTLAAHLSHECAAAKIYKCYFCDKTFSQKNNCKTHMGLIHRAIMS